MNDFEPVIWLDDGFLPPRPRKNIEISLDRHALRRHFEMSQKRGNGEAVGNLSKFSVNSYIHRNQRDA
jgi:hypothetical protein